MVSPSVRIVYQTCMFLHQNVNAHKSEATFYKFGLVVVYHISFFIFVSTIGLNIIFGIIVDTFSELRDLKVTNSILVMNQIVLLNVLNGSIFGHAFSFKLSGSTELQTHVYICACTLWYGFSLI